MKDCNEYCEPICKSMPEVDFSICAPKYYAGQVSNIYLTIKGNTLINYIDADEWAIRLALPYGDPFKIITIPCIGDKPEPDVSNASGAYGNIQYSHKNHKVNLTIRQLSDANYALISYFEKYKDATGWYSTSSGKMYGGKGVDMKIYINDIIPEANNDLEKIIGYVSWEAAYHPCRSDSPI